MCVCVCLGVLCSFDAFVCCVCKRTEWCFKVWLLYHCLCVPGCCLMCVMCGLLCDVVCVCCCAVVSCLVVLCVRVCLVKCVCVVVCALSCDVAMCCMFNVWLLSTVFEWLVCGFVRVVVWCVVL